MDVLGVDVGIGVGIRVGIGIGIGWTRDRRKDERVEILDLTRRRVSLSGFLVGGHGHGHGQDQE